MNAKTFLFICTCIGLHTASSDAHGDPHLEIEKVSRQIQAKPTAALYLKRGELQREHGDFHQALSDYQIAEELDPAMDMVLFYRGKALFESGRHTPARAALDQFLEKKPDHGEGYLIRARVLTALKDHASATKDHDRSIEFSKEPRPEQFVERALALEQAGDPNAAIQGLDAGMERLGPIWTLQSVVIEIEVRDQRYDSALKRLDRLIGEAQRKESWQALRAEILVKAGRGDEARQAYQDSLASIEALPPRLRSLKATQELEKKIRTAVTAMKPA